MNLIGLFGLFLLLTSTADSSLLDPVIENVRHIKASHPPDKISGMWKKKMLWKPRWIKEWKSSNVLKPVWRKFWGPIIIREWVPIPKPPPQWDGVHASPPEPHSKPPGVPFIDVTEPPLPNFSYLQKNPSPNSYKPPKQTHHSINIPGAFSDAGPINYKAPHLPITSGYKSQAETYSGQSSYGSNVDSGAYDLNPPVEQFNSNYSYRPTFGNQGQAHHAPASLLTIKPGAPHSHIHHGPPHQHHHYHHHHVKWNGHPHSSHTPDLTKFPPDWNSWEPTHPKPHSHHLPGLTQATSAVSIVSQVQSTTEKYHEAVGDHLFSQGLLPGDNDFIQQAALVSEYHYTENPLQNSISATPINPPLIYSYLPEPIPSHGSNQTQSHSAVLNRPNVSAHVPPVQHLKSSPPPITPTRPVPDVSHKTPSLPSHIAQTNAVHAFHQPTPKPSHNSKFSSSQVPPPNAASPKPNHPKVVPSLSFHISNPVQTPPLPPPRILPSASPNSPTGQFNTPINVHSQPHPNRQNPAHPRKPGPVPSQTPPIASPPLYPNSATPKKTSPSKSESVKNQKAHLLEVPEFKALPSTSVEAFHFIKGFPSNQTFTKAALIGNINHTRVEENQVEIIAAKPQQKEIPPYVAKLAQAIVNQHLKKVEETSSTVTEETTTEAPTGKATVTIVYPSTNPFIKKTLKAYLADESKEKSTKVFVVTPVPHKVESSRDVSSGV